MRGEQPKQKAKSHEDAAMSMPAMLFVLFCRFCFVHACRFLRFVPAPVLSRCAIKIYIRAIKLLMAEARAERNAKPAPRCAKSAESSKSARQIIMFMPLQVRARQKEKDMPLHIWRGDARYFRRRPLFFLPFIIDLYDIMRRHGAARKKRDPCHSRHYAWMAI